MWCFCSEDYKNKAGRNKNKIRKIISFSSEHALLRFSCSIGWIVIETLCRLGSHNSWKDAFWRHLVISRGLQNLWETQQTLRLSVSSFTGRYQANAAFRARLLTMYAIMPLGWCIFQKLLAVCSLQGQGNKNVWSTFPSCLCTSKLMSGVY